MIGERDKCTLREHASRKLLLVEKGGDGKTGLQLLSCNPSSSFRQEPGDGFVKFWCSGQKGVRERQEVLLSIRTLYQMKGVQETLLILASKSGCVEIVEEMVKLY